MGIYIFNWDILKKYLIEDEADPNSENDFGNNIIPNLLKDGRAMYAYHFSGYWKDVGTIPSLWEANMEVLDPEHSGINLFDTDWKIYSRNSGGDQGRRCGESLHHRRERGDRREGRGGRYACGRRKGGCNRGIRRLHRRRRQDRPQCHGEQ